MKKSRYVRILLAGYLVLASIAYSATIEIGNGFGDWTLVRSLGRDQIEGLSPCDWREVYATHDDNNWYIRYDCAGDINFNVPAAYNIFVDIDRDRWTGYRGSGGDFPLGAEYLVQGGVLFAYAGEGTTWNWVEKQTLEYAFDGPSAEIAVPRTAIDSPKTVAFFLYGDNTAIVASSSTDTMPDGALNFEGTGGRFRYSFKDSK